ncbi:hypothetical protein BPOR_1120g00030 [Botrytis porri]|uniref:FAD-binding PCMH-type domain-containing protein n=1 Tax=Botrytis porri TaxID=87229 RepID=A0A4Z1K7R8_9HELO|nr:hypothetical protein BPOR_1120g00030 [Botrytis porri]
MYSHIGRIQCFLFILIHGTNCHSIWTSLNQTLNDRLHTSRPFSYPFFPIYEGQRVTPNQSQCAEIQHHYTSSEYRAQFYNGFMNNQDEICFTNATDQCVLNNILPADANAFTNVSCNQGIVSEYYVQVEEVSDVVAALKFSRKTGIRLSMKNSGHDYLSRSSRKGSLALWMRKVSGMSYETSFVPKDCDSAPVNVITTAAGVNTNDVYEFAETQNVTFIGGYATTIGVAGGWVQAGGHSVLSPVYGLGIDRVVQYKIITTDGVLRIANECKNSDLFWALRGGGGGTFGIVMEVTHRVEPRVQLAVAAISYNRTSVNVLEWLSVIVNNSLPWANQGWGGHYQAANLISVTPLLSLSEAAESMTPAMKFANENDGTWDPASTSSTPEWRDSIWELSYGGAWKYNETLEQRTFQIDLVNNLTAMVEEFTPTGGAYFNEAHPWTSDWKEAWWGLKNYERLVEIKKKYDPDNLLTCWKCVGFDQNNAAKDFHCLDI